MGQLVRVSDGAEETDARLGADRTDLSIPEVVNPTVRTSASARRSATASVASGESTDARPTVSAPSRRPSEGDTRPTRGPRSERTTRAGSTTLDPDSVATVSATAREAPLLHLTDHPTGAPATLDTARAGGTPRDPAPSDADPALVRPLGSATGPWSRVARSPPKGEAPHERRSGQSGDEPTTPRRAPWRP
ncbi:hypothetical protein GCM10023175_57990 [Pseudonocardia xishanensis]|uniref:Uncharacterized protein n=1 Tax=Pseudonocardia xishanensis TaxID=630995 RepID=A0ABP8RZX0_9PSEU